ncbi:hypothetical protein L5G28_17980 [Gordonia sp. HY285]|uniref:hypothetical protein n=1 Tax=Gordonia liuliyuniae TaxID=2911517 RepID=UPI001F2CEA45|nr:hypothetical protein [Gordonia liuliyuniae]MCF8612035.1 hypothetical protein [Gordonia liuliyuniae]
MNSDETREPDSVDESVSDETSLDGSDEAGVDETGVDEAGVDEAGVDETGASQDPVDSDDDTDSDDTDSGDTDSGETDGGRHWAASMALAVAVTALVAAIVCVGYFGYTGIRAYTVDANREQMRVHVVDAAEQAMLNILTVDDKGVDVWQKRMKSSLTGDALKQAIDETSGGAVKQIEAAKDRKLTIKASIIRSATTEFNPDEDTATVFVLSQAATSEAPNQPQAQSSLLSVVKVDDTWKVDKIVPLTDITYYDDTAEPATGEQQQGTEQQQEGGN